MVQLKIGRVSFEEKYNGDHKRPCPRINRTMAFAPRALRHVEEPHALIAHRSHVQQPQASACCQTGVTRLQAFPYSEWLGPVEDTREMRISCVPYRASSGVWPDQVVSERVLPTPQDWSPSEGQEGP